MRLGGALIAVAATAVSAPAAADPDAPDRGELCWRYDVGLGVVVPILFQDYEDATSFGGRLLVRSTRGWIATQVDLDLLSRENGPAPEQVGYRVRALGGLRWRNEPDVGRAVELRVMAGVELAGMDKIDADWVADRYSPGFAGELTVENRNRLDWGSVALTLGLGASVQPFGDDDQTSYPLGLDILFGFAVSK